MCGEAATRVFTKTFDSVCYILGIVVDRECHHEVEHSAKEPRSGSGAALAHGHAAMHVLAKVLASLPALLALAVKISARVTSRQTAGVLTEGAGLGNGFRASWASGKVKPRADMNLLLV